MADKAFHVDAYHVAILLGLLGALWYVASWYFGCGIVPIPSSCDVFWGISRFSEGGKARVLIVYGDSGLGDPQLLEKTLSNPGAFIAPARSMHIDRISTGNLKEYDLVIVEKARKLGSEDLVMFMDYVRGGGRLVWTGDAGTLIEKGDQLLFEYERPKGSDENRVSSPWARKIGSRVVAFDEFISVDYIANFCELKTCTGTPFIGIFEAPNRSHDLVKAIRPDLKMYGDFSIVKVRSDAYSTSVLNVDALSDIIADRDVYTTNAPLQTTPECNDNVDNDGDGLIDYSGIDLDGDGVPEYKPDPGCTSPTDDYERGSVTPSEKTTECNDGNDNDNDDKTDYPFDECCLNAQWDNENSCKPNSTECSDGVDNDNDGKIDFGKQERNDDGCYAASDASEGTRDLGRIFPIIVTSKLGQKVAYYSIPPEFFVSSQMPIDPQTGQRITYRSLIENMYYGMIR